MNNNLIAVADNIVTGELSEAEKSCSDAIMICDNATNMTSVPDQT